ncbi:MAG: D-glucuronyl C5-epimerase family protein [Helicobacteraceae bacterium]
MTYFKDFCQDVDVRLNDDYSHAGKYVFYSQDLWQIGTLALGQRYKIDSAGVLLTRYDDGFFVNPSYLAYYGLLNFQKFLETSDEIFINRVSSAVAWIEASCLDHSAGGIGAKKWPYNFNWHNGKTLLKSGWVSAMAQGLIISLLIRWFHFTRDGKYLDLARAGANMYRIDIANGGVRATHNGKVYFEEYAAYPLSLVLDGFLFSLVGIYELSLEDNTYAPDFKLGLDFLNSNLSIWNFYSIWTRYGFFDGRQDFSTNVYNTLNIALLRFFQKIAAGGGHHLLLGLKMRPINKYVASVLNLPNAIIRKFINVWHSRHTS